jgi:pyruvate carboxylase subunit B|tara:strand:- start:1568 stop:3376 length:1809 start_codon:yes stop_codon:yes gene_type:complete
MSKKYIDIMDTTFRDGFQSVFGGRVLMQDFMPAVEEAAKAGVKHFEFGGGARFQSLFFYLNENAFDMMDMFREIVGPDANLQTLSRGINTVALDTGSREIVDLHAKMFKKHGTTTIRNFDALNDVSNLSYSAECVNRHGLKHEAVITMMDLPPGCEGAHTVEFYEKILKQILDSEMKFSSLCFKDASGTSHPKKVYETIKMAKSLLPDNSHVRFHTHETAGVSVACYLAALEAGADGIDTAVDPLSGGTSQPDILTMLHATKNSNYNLGDLENNKILKYREVLIESLKEYYFPSEAQKVSPLIPFSPMPGGALTANTQMMRDNNILEKFPSVIDAMGEVVSKGGYGTSVTPVSQFYWQQAFSNVMFGEWEKIADGYGRMVLGYFGKTPTTPDSKIVELASKQLELDPTTENPLDIADRDERKSLDYWKNILSEKEIDVTEENIFIAAACAEKGIEFLEGKGKVNVRKITDEESSPDNKASKKSSKASTYTIVLNGESFNVQVAEGSDVEIAPTTGNNQSSSSQLTNDISSSDGESVPAPVNGNVIKVLCSIGDSVEPDQTVMVLESMKMEIEVKAGVSGKVNAITVDQGQNVEEGETILLVS